MEKKKYFLIWFHWFDIWWNENFFKPKSKKNNFLVKTIQNWKKKKKNGQIGAKEYVSNIFQCMNTYHQMEKEMKK